MQVKRHHSSSALCIDSPLTNWSKICHAFETTAPLHGAYFSFKATFTSIKHATRQQEDVPRTETRELAMDRFIPTAKSQVKDRQSL